MIVHIPTEARTFGFAFGPGGTHTSRTMMLSELRLLLAACPQQASYDAYRASVTDDNVLLKQTITTRLRSLRGLRELYGLRPDILLFRALRDLWDSTPGEQPLLALLCATARDPLLRATTETIVTRPEGTIVSSHMLAEAVGHSFPDRYNDATLNKIGRNTISSWQQSGHLAGRAKKVRVCATPGPAVTAYALLLGHLCGVRGAALFATPWAQLLDASPHTLDSLAFAAAQRGWLDYRRIGDVADIGFSWLLRENREEQ